MEASKMLSQQVNVFVEDKLKKIKRHRQDWLRILREAGIYGDYVFYCTERHRDPKNQRRARMFFVKKFGRDACSYVARYNYQEFIKECIRIAKAPIFEDE